MAPNLLVATQTLFQPRKWFRQNKAEKPKRKTERWLEPVPGIYEHIPGRGWYLIEKNLALETIEVSSKGGPVLTVEEATSKASIKMNPPVQVRYSKVLKRYMLSPDYEDRKKGGDIENTQGKKIHVKFFRLDNEVSWVNFLDENGEFIPGPYKLWMFDQSIMKFRHMLRRDDPEYQRSQTNSLVQSRQNSVDRDLIPRRYSQESRSTEYRGGGSNRDGQSGPSTRANTRPNSKAPSQANSRRGSLSRGPLSPLIPLDEAGASLKKVQKERAAKEAAAKHSVPDQIPKEKTATEPEIAASIADDQAFAAPSTFAKEPTSVVHDVEKGQHAAEQCVAVGT